jgi:amidase
MADERVSSLVAKAARSLEALGAIVEDVSLPMHRDAPDIWAVIGRMSATTSLLGKACGPRQLCLNDLTERMLPIDQVKLDRMLCSGVNTVINGLWGWEHMPPALMGKATNLVRKLKDAYYAALDRYDVLVMPTRPFLPPKLPTEGASVKELMVNSAGVSLNTSAFNIVRRAFHLLTLHIVDSNSRRGCRPCRFLLVSYPTTSTRLRNCPWACRS